MSTPAPATTTARPRALLLPGLYEACAARAGMPRRWADLPLGLRGDARVIWAAARSGQTDPWLAALTGWRRRAARYRQPSLPGPTTPSASRANAGQYLALATYLIAHQNPPTTPKEARPR